jgi:hypothetical protein
MRLLLQRILTPELYPDEVFFTAQSATRGFLEAAGAFSMRRLLRPVPAYGHAAPTSSTAARAIDKEKRAQGPLACLHLREVLLTDQVSHCARDGEQQRVGRAPAPLESPRELRGGPPMATIDGHNLSERFITREHTVQRLEFLQHVLPQGASQPARRGLINVASLFWP